MRALLRRSLIAAFAGPLLGGAVGGCETSDPARRGEGALASRSAPVLDGVPDADENYRNVVGIKAGDGRICSGSLISPNLVLTARHCVSRSAFDDVICGEGALGATLEPSALQITVGGEAGEGGGPWLPVAEIWVPPGDDDICGHDIALLLLDTLINDVPPLVPYISSNVETERLFTAVGFGGDKTDGSNIGVRRAGFDFVVTCVSDDCGYGDLFHTNEWRGGGASGKAVCRGDSGGPALVGTNYVGGVLSRLFGIGDGGSSCGVPIYTSTYAWASFLQTRAVRAAVAGRYRLPDWARGGGGVPPEMRFGNECESNLDCTSDGTCVFEGERSYCSYDCGPTPGVAAAGAPCPGADYECDQAVGLCIAVTTRPNELSCFGDAGLCADAEASSQTNNKGSCSLSSAPRGSSSASAAWLLGLLALVGLRVRRSRTM
jgi:hypothetical protein